jgi:hypothetical protein
MLAAALGRTEEAKTLLDASARLSQRLQSPTWLARTLLEQARLVRGVDRTVLATQALALTNETGAVGIERRIRALLDE